MPINTGLTYNRAVAEERVLAAITAIGAALQLEPVVRPQRHRRPEVNEVRTVEWTATSLEAIAARLTGVVITEPDALDEEPETGTGAAAETDLIIEALISRGVAPDDAEAMAPAVMALSVAGSIAINAAVDVALDAFRAVGSLPAGEPGASDVDTTGIGEPSTELDPDSIELIIDPNAALTEPPLTPQQKAARTRAANAAAQTPTT